MAILARRFSLPSHPPCKEVCFCGNVCGPCESRWKVARIIGHRGVRSLLEQVERRHAQEGRLGELGPRKRKFAIRLLRVVGLRPLRRAVPVRAGGTSPGPRGRRAKTWHRVPREYVQAPTRAEGVERRNLGLGAKRVRRSPSRVCVVRSTWVRGQAYSVPHTRPRGPREKGKIGVLLEGPILPSCLVQAVLSLFTHWPDCAWRGFHPSAGRCEKR